MSHVEIKIYTENEAGSEAIAKLCENLSQLIAPITLSLVSTKPQDAFYLSFHQQKFYLVSNHQELAKLSPLSLNWDEVYLELKKNISSYKNTPLYKVFFKHEKEPSVLDATLGLGKDSLTLLSLGARVQAYERNPYLFCLAYFELWRLKQMNSLGKFPLEIYYGQLDQAVDRPIYYDPMYQAKKSGALPPKEMQILKKLVGEDSDQAAFASALLKLAPKLVVKRPDKATYLMGKPNHEVGSKLIRLDVYLPISKNS